MAYWYIPYIVHAAYPHIAVPFDSRSVRLNETSSFPPVNTTRFHSSAKQTLDLMKQVELLTTKIANSADFANELMQAAQASDQKKVDELITSAGISTTFQSKYTPDGIRIQVHDKAGICCELILTLHW
ncbi:hypothetical protein [Sporosarcina quadrami]|nr:hypothetical protein [Sporosarcina quadrami]